MSFKSAVQPLCRYCGCPIKKQTHTVFFGHPERRDTFSTSLPAKPTTREEAQKCVNEKIVSISWSYRHREWNEMDQPRQKEYISKVTTWDGESYHDEYFCNAQHAMALGYAAARAGNVMAAYNEAKGKVSG